MANFILPLDGVWKNMEVPSKANQAYAEGEIVYSDGTDLVPGTTTSQKLFGIVQKAKASAANTDPITVRVPMDANCTFKAVATGTLTAAYVGRGFDLATSTSVAQGATTYKPVILMKFIDANTGVFAFNYAMGVNAS